VTLYHYSPLIHLPPILREGLWNGEIAQPDPRRHEVAVSLTTQTDPDRLVCWSTTDPWKTAVRYVCQVADRDPRLEPARDAWQRLRVPPKARKALDPCGQSKWWYFYKGTIPVDQLTVQLRSEAGYVPVTDLDRVVEAVSVERDKFHFVVPEGLPFILDLVPKDKDAPPSWILSEVFPAERFAVGG
jgi:hypothetical protein